MPITIQELIASDTISQAVDKINFNFDQLLLNGGGPSGPAGPIGPTGPVGGRGLRGATWYHDPAAAPGTDPNTLIIATVEDDDYYLQANGDVWQYNGTLWVLTTVNLIGPTGPSGSSFGFNYAGGYPGAASINNQNIAYIVPMPGGTGSGANQATNEAVSVAVFGGIASTATPPSGISFTPAFLIPDVMTKSLDSSLLSVLIHQKDSSAAAIKFMGGGAIPADNYEQSVLGNLSEISLGVDDSLNINIPKAATSPLSISDLIGFNLNTIKRGQQFYSGKHINFLSGVDLTPSGLGAEISDISFIVGTSNPSNPAKFAVSTTFASASATFEVGGNITLPSSITTKTGTILGEANNVTLWGNTVLMASAPNNRIRVDSGAVQVYSEIAPINITTINTSINVSSDVNLNLTAVSNTTITAGGQILLTTGGIGQIYLEPGFSTNGLRVVSDSVSGSGYGAVGIRGNLIWKAGGYGTPFTASHRNITINADDIAPANPAIYALRQGSGTPGSSLLATFQKRFAFTLTERVDIFTSAVEIYNTSSMAGFVGFQVSNTSAGVTTNFGVKTIGRDSITNNQGNKFWAGQDTTAVYNRFQYVKKDLIIDPLTAGIPLTGTYTIPSTYMDASFLDVMILGTSGPAGISASGDSFTLAVPDGSYVGQRLNLHVFVAPARRYDSGTATQYNWPNGMSGNVGIRLNSFAGSSQVLGTATCGPWNGTPVQGAEFYAELLWVGSNYNTHFITSSGTTIKTMTRGWVVTNLLSPTITSASATNTEAQMKAQVNMT